jgi:cephalosporin-C deacetylase
MDPFENQRKEWQEYLPPLTRPADLDAFWEEARAQVRDVPLAPSRRKIDFPCRGVDVYDITFEGVDRTVIHGWLLVPTLFGAGPFPCLVHYHGYGGDRGWPADFMPWVMLGAAVVSVDCRDQSGETGSGAAWSAGSMGHHVLRGILNPREHYLRALYTDALRALDFACSQPEVDPSRVVVEGGSQGGGLSIAMSALDSRPFLALADVPSYSDLTARVLGGHGAMASVADYLKKYPDRTERCLATLNYFDTMNLADRIRAEVYVSVGGRDPVCPAKCFFATYNRIASPKAVEIYPFNGHEGGGSRHFARKLMRLRDALAARA